MQSVDDDDEAQPLFGNDLPPFDNALPFSSDTVPPLSSNDSPLFSFNKSTPHMFAQDTNPHPELSFPDYNDNDKTDETQFRFAEDIQDKNNNSGNIEFNSGYQGENQQSDIDNNENNQEEVAFDFGQHVKDNNDNDNGEQFRRDQEEHEQTDADFMFSEQGVGKAEVDGGQYIPAFKQKDRSLTQVSGRSVDTTNVSVRPFESSSQHHSGGSDVARPQAHNESVDGSPLHGGARPREGGREAASERDPAAHLQEKYRFRLDVRQLDDLLHNGVMEGDLLYLLTGLSLSLPTAPGQPVSKNKDQLLKHIADHRVICEARRAELDKTLTQFYHSRLYVHQLEAAEQAKTLLELATGEAATWLLLEKLKECQLNRAVTVAFEQPDDEDVVMNSKQRADFIKALAAELGVDGASIDATSLPGSLLIQPKEGMSAPELARDITAMTPDQLQQVAINAGCPQVRLRPVVECPAPAPPTHSDGDHPFNPFDDSSLVFPSASSSLPPSSALLAANLPPDCLFSHAHLEEHLLERHHSLSHFLSVVRWLEDSFRPGRFEAEWKSSEQLLGDAWELVRGGKLEEAIRLCVARGLYLHAAALRGGRRWHVDSEHGGSKGNRRRDLWQKQCRSKSKASSGVEAVLYGILGNHLELEWKSGNETQGALRDWADLAWADLKCLTGRQVDRLVRSSLKRAIQYNNEEDQQNFAMFSEPFITAVEPHSDENAPLFPDHDHASLTREVDSLLQQAGHRQAPTPYQVIQRHLILGQHRELLDTLVEESGEPNCPPSFLAFAVHLYLFLQPLQQLTVECDDVGLALVVNYLTFLRQNKMLDLVLAYAQLLPSEHLIEVYAEFLAELPADKRETYLSKASKAFSQRADVVQGERFLVTLTKTVVGHVFNRPLPLEESEERALVVMGGERSAGTDDDTVTTADAERMRALDCFFQYQPSLHEQSVAKDLRGADMYQAVHHANQLFRLFAGNSKLAAIRALHARLLQLESRVSIGAVPSNASPARAWAFREYRCWGLYSYSYVRYKAWAQTFFDSPCQIFSEPHTAEEQELIEQWEKEENRKYNEAREAAYDALNFADGWLTPLRPRGFEAKDQVPSDEEQEVKGLRDRCVPELVYTLHFMSHQSKRYTDAVDLAVLVASEQEGHRLYQSFKAEEMKVFLGKIRQSSVALEVQRIHSEQNKK